MGKICRPRRLNGSFYAMDDSPEGDGRGKNIENYARTNSASSGTLWGNFHD
jgi:hypothetical protein